MLRLHIWRRREDPQISQQPSLAVRSVSGEGHLTVNFPPPKEASTRVRLLIVLGVSVITKIITNSTSDRIKTI
jgi:hypothetical protein